MYGMSARCTVVSAVLSGAGSRQLNRKKVSVIEMILPLPFLCSGKNSDSVYRPPSRRSSSGPVYGVVPPWGCTHVSF
jgi:hypothetical protein